MFSFYRPLGRSHTRTSSSKVGVGKPKTESGNKVVTVRAAAAATTTTRVVAVIVRSGNDRGKHEQDRFLQIKLGRLQVSKGNFGIAGIG